MFTETKKYTCNGQFVFRNGDLLSEVSIGVPDKPGVYYFIGKREGVEELVYIGKSGTMQQHGEFRDQMLRAPH